MTSENPRPPMWVGHVTLKTNDIAKSRAFMMQLGVRSIKQGADFAVLELRGGTHLVLSGSDEVIHSGGSAPFDFMVDDLEESHRRYGELGLCPSEIKKGRIHSSFTVVDPSGHEITINSSHVSGRPV